MSTPTRPIKVRQSFNSASGASGTPRSFNAESLRAAYAGTATPPPNIPPRAGTPSSQSQGINVGSAASPGPGIGGISAQAPSPAPDTPPVNLDELPEEEKARVLQKHLVHRDERNATPTGEPSTAPRVQRQDSEAFPVPYHAPGADVVHDIYKWQQGQQRVQNRQRAVSFAGSTATPEPAFEHIHEPGGFRRNYLLTHQEQNGEQGTAAPSEGRMLNNFVEFLYIFGHFAGEDLEEVEEEDEEEYDEEEARRREDVSFTPGQVEGGILRVEPLPSTLSVRFPSERTPLLPTTPATPTRKQSRSASRRRKLSSTEHGEHGDATVGQAVLMLLKAFVGTGVLFLGKAFFNGGLLFSAITISLVCLISLYSFLLLVQTKFVVPGSFGDIGGALYGPWMRYVILTSVAVSQIGFVSAYTIFVAENLQSFVLGVTNCEKLVPIAYLILIQLVVLLPLALVRNLAKLSSTALLADVFILAGLIYVFSSEFSLIAKRGIAHVEYFNPDSFPLFIGTAVFSFEGIGLVIPITDAMKEPRKFPAVLSGVMIGLLFLFGGAGALAYLTFGSDIKTVVLVNLNTASPVTQAVQFLYSLAILLSIPLQLFPAVRIVETGLFNPTLSGKGNTRVKWLKNGFRFVVTFFCAALAWAGASDLDKFVSLIGSFACVPLCFTYPAMLHYKACARTKKQKAADIALGIFGIVAATYTTVQTLIMMAKPTPAGPSPIAQCMMSP
ncbi:hypothetical protein PENSPDRAFT_655685 [Peniophora sp. CONT]|nr:hypothetical protein PENSPDRAFT_655685 [Peniophora sp. CONT]